MLAAALKQPLERLIGARLGSDFLFPGTSQDGTVSTRRIERLVEAAGQKAGIKKKVTPHTLRHSFATYLLEAGTDIRYIQQLLGHTRLEATKLYTQVQNPSLLRVRSPL